MNVDLVITGGRVIDPANGVDAICDLAVVGGKVAAVGDLSDVVAANTVDASGLIVTPGLVDIHAHVFATTGIRNAWAGDSSVLPDGFTFRSGVTTLVDAGSAGWRLFEDLRYTVLDRFETRMFALLNIVGMGMASTASETNPVDMDVDQAVAMAEEHNDVIVGIKTAHYQGPEWTSVERMLEATGRLGLPGMVDFGVFPKERPYYELVTEKMRPGDITTHMFLADVPWVDDEGRVLPYFQQARDRGVIFDVGHGGGSFFWRNAVPAIEQGFYPDSISTDMHALNVNAAMQDMATVMSKLLILGMPLVDIIRASTTNPAREIGHSELGQLAVGSEADIALFEVLEGDFGYLDVAGGLVRGDRRLQCELTLLGGEAKWDRNGRTGTNWRVLPPDYGVRNKTDGLIMPPGSTH